MSCQLYHVPDDGMSPDPGTLGVYAEIRRLTEVEAFLMWEDLIAAPPEVQAFAGVRMAALRARLFGQEELVAA